MYCQAAADVSDPPSRTGMRPNATVPDSDAEEAAREEQVERAPLDEEADAREHAHERSDDRDGGVERRAARPGARTTDFSESLAAKSAVPAASRQTRRTSPRSHER